MYQTPDMNLWRGRINPIATDLLLHQVVKPLDMTNDLFSPIAPRSFSILGFCCDEGVRRNLGRTGARNAPDQIRKICSGIAIHFDPEQVGITDAGNVLCPGQNLEAAQRLLAEKVYRLLQQGYFPIVLGGGHETAFGHFQGIRGHVGPDKKIGIINLDAHFDLRRYDQGPHSGSPFRQIAEQIGSDFHYLPIGIRPESNIKSMFDFMDEHRQSYILLADLLENWQSVRDHVKSFVEQMDHIYLTIDMDCFPAAYAPGVSAAAPDGLLPYHVIQLIRQIQHSGKLTSLDIVEVNPEYDIDDRTLKLVAELVFHILHDGRQ